MTTPLTVQGGRDGVEAHYDDMVAAARLFGQAAGDTTGTALRLHRYLLDPDVVASAVFDPAGAALFEARLITALDGPAGVSWIAARCATLDLGLRAAAAAYLGADRLDERFAPEVGALTHGPRALIRGVSTLAPGDVSGALEEIISADPELADLGIGFGADLLGAGSVTAGTRLLGGLFDDGAPRVAALGTDHVADRAGPPRCLTDLLAGLCWRASGRSGEIDVRLLTGVDASGLPIRKVIVDIPGTRTWSPALHNADVTSLATNLRAIGGGVTSYEQGIVEAMRRAGVRRDDDVLLVGHSEGGMVALNAARHLAQTGEFSVGHVITAGAPIGLTAGAVPSRVDVLALENSGDVVPHLDDAANPDRVNITTVTVHHDHADLGANHDLRRSYLPGAADIDASDDPSVRGYLAGLGGFLTASLIETRSYVITRRYR